MKVGFVGLGAMGRAMAGSLLAAGHELHVYNRTRERVVPLHEAGARIARSPAEAAHEAEVVVSMLADDAAVESVTFGGQGVLAGLAPGAVHVSGSTISLALAERLTAAHAEAKRGFVAAPVFGRPEAAAVRQLWVLAAGAERDVAHCLPVLEALGRGVIRLGETPSAANVVKLGGNFLIAAMIESLGEAFALTRKAGVPPKVFLDVCAHVLGRGSPIFENYAALIAREGYAPAGFKVPLGLKDVELALAAGASLAAPLPTAELLRAQLRAVIDGGNAHLDWSAIAQLAAERAGLR